MTDRMFSRLLAAVAAAAAGCALTLATPAGAHAGVTARPAAAARPAAHPAKTAASPARAAPAAGDARAACGAKAQPGYATCFALMRTNVKGRRGMLGPGQAPTGYGPSDLQSAYNLPSSTAGSGQTVAIVDAFDDPTAEADLQVYRAQYGLPVCDTANGCFEKVNQKGEQGDYPAPDPTGGWETEESLDVDMVSAVCPSCHILLVEADNAALTSLGAAVNEAVALGAKFESDSWGCDCEFSSETAQSSQYFNHPGVAITAAAGDNGYGASFPAVSQYVTSVGGTTLTQDPGTTRGWNETVWANPVFGGGTSGTNSGCSRYIPKPSWQHDKGCADRTDNDVAAVADPDTGVAVYDSDGGSSGADGWAVFGGTSVASPIIASTYALAGTPAAGRYPASYPYADPSALNDVIRGMDGFCSPSVDGKPAQYLCRAGKGYDGPTGLGTPDGIAAFSAGATGQVAGTITNASTGQPIAGATVDAGSYSTTTSSSGQYDLGVPPGSYDVTLKAYGYAAQTIPGVPVASGQTQAENAALATVPDVTLTGTVTDGSGHGWPLYAKVTVPGTPASATTDPATGKYTLTLPADASYHVLATPLYQGYQSAAASVTVGSHNRSHSFTVPVNPDTCQAPGYQPQGLFEPFTDDTSTPAGWAVTDGNGSGGLWQFGSTSLPSTNPPGNDTGGGGNYAQADSYGANGTVFDTSLTSPVVDMATAKGAGTPVVSFDTSSNANSNEINEVDVSTDGGQTWTAVWKYVTALNTLNIPPGSTAYVPMPQAAGQADVRVRFDYTGSASWWQLDNIRVARCLPEPGGLIVGHVTDANTGTTLNGAMITSPGGSAVSGKTGLAPGATGTGLYVLPVTSGGSTTLTASELHYQTASASIDVAASSVTAANFSLKAGQVSVTPTQVTATGTLGSSMTRTVTLTNTGTAPATINLADTSSSMTTNTNQAADRVSAPLQRIQGRFTLTPDQKSAAAARPPATHTGAQPSAAPWAKIANYPMFVDQNAVVTDPATGLVYSVGGYAGNSPYGFTYVYSPATGHWTQLPSMKYQREAPVATFINGKLYVAGGIGSQGTALRSLEVYDPAASTWSAGAKMPDATYGSSAAVLDGKMYVIGGSPSSGVGTDVQVYNPSTNTWRQAAPYPEPIGYESCGAPASQIFCAGGATGNTTETSGAYSYNPATGTWSPIAPLPTQLWGSGYTAANGQLLVSGGVTADNTAITNQGYAYSPWSGTWSKLPNAPHAVYEAGSGCGLYEAGGLTDASVVGIAGPLAGAEQLPGYSACGPTDVPWLSASPSEVTLKPGQSTTVTVTLNAADASMPQPGTYTAGLIIENSTPYQVPDIGVTMTVTPPKAWGELTGAVTSGGKPLAGATVQIGAKKGSGQIYTTTTNANGQYTWWLPGKDNPERLIASDSGYAPQTQKARITAGQTTTANFVLQQQ